MISGPTVPGTILNLGQHGGNEAKIRTWWDFELRRKLNRFTDLDYAIRDNIIQEALKMENKNGW